MKQRLTRLKIIKNLIKSYPIESQEMLLGYLDREGFSVTQATLSRDLKLLKVSRSTVYSDLQRNSRKQGSYNLDFGKNWWTYSGLVTSYYN